MKISTIIGVLVGLSVAGGAWYWVATTTVQLAQQTSDYKNATYRIEGQSVTLINGRAEAATSSAMKVTQYFGNEATGDLNGDGISDIAFLLTQNAGGSGTFYYVVAALKTLDGYQGTDAVLLGDRIAPQSTEIKNGLLIVNYADRVLGESFAVPPSTGKSVTLKLDSTTLQFGEVTQNFEGEADPARMTLDMQTWKWIETSYNNDTKVLPKKADTFTLIFKKDGTFSAATDCNGVGGIYTVQGNTITFGEMMSTLMYCEGSQESTYTGMLTAAHSFFFTSKGELVFDLKFDTGTMTFR